MESLESILAKHPFFSGLDEKHFATIVGCASNVRFDAGSTMFRQGDEANRFYLIRHGKVAVQVPATGGTPVTIQTVGDGNVLGWSWLVPPHYWRFDAQAIEPVRAIAMDGRCLRGKCEDDHDLGYELLKRFSAIMAERLEMTRVQLLDIYGVPA